MPQTISSAQPEKLLGFADIVSAQGEEIAAEGRRLADALDRLLASCREYSLGDIGSLGDSVQALGRRDAELAGWVRGVAEAFLAADSTWGAPPSQPACAPVEQPNPAVEAARWISSAAVGLVRWQVDQEIREAEEWLAGGQAAITTAVNTIDQASWNWAALRLHASLSFVDAATWISGDSPLGTSVGVVLSSQTLFPSLLDIGGLIVLEDGQRWTGEPVDELTDMLSLFEQGFWNMAFNKVAPDLLLALAADIEDLNRRICDETGTGANPRPSSLDETNLTPLDVFPGATADPATGNLTIPAESIMAGEHSAISPYHDEQISLFRIGEDEYVFAICGLDLLNMANSPNGLVAVIQTATDPDAMHNAYYRLIKERFLRYLEQIPPGSDLNLVGHSMGGGMTMLLLNDPEIQAVLVSGGYTLNSVVLYGAVRPMDWQSNGIPPTQPSELAPTLFSGTEVRVYVDPEDRLAMNVGAGHLTEAGLPMPNVYLVDDGDLSSATGAHTGYYNPTGYDDLPAELQDLPFHVDSYYWEHYRSPDEIPDIDADEWSAPVNTAPESVA